MKLRRVVAIGALVSLTGPLISAQDGPSVGVSGAAADETVHSVPPAEAMFTVLVTYPKDNTGATKHEEGKRIQVAFLIDEVMAITPFSGLQRSSKVEGTFDGRKKFQLKVVGTDLEHDLALVQLKDEASGAEGAASGALEKDESAAEPDSGMPRWLRLGQDSERGPLDDGMWTVYFDPLAPGSARVVSSPELLRQAKRSGATARGIGGLPIVDAEGHLAGVWRWTRPGGGAESQTIDLSVLRAFVARCRGSEGEGRKSALEGGLGISLAFPLLSWTGDASKGAVPSAVKDCKEFIDWVGCSFCGKKGYKVRPWSELKGNKKIQHEDHVECERCDGCRIIDSRPLWGKACTLAAILTGLPRTHGDLTAINRALEEGVRDAAALNPGLFLERLADSAREELDSTELIPGRSVMFPVHHSKWPADDAPGWPERVRLLRGQYGPMILVDPDARNVIHEGEYALVVATVAGSVAMDGEDWIVLEHGFVVPIKPEGEQTGR